MPFDPEIPLPLAVFAADTQGRLRYRLPLATYTNSFEAAANTMWISPQVEAITGYRADEWVGRPGFVEELLHPDDRKPVIEEMRQSREHLRPFSRDYRLRARDGRIVWIHDESVPVLDATGRPEFIQGYFLDITERKALEQALAHAQKVEAVGRLAGEIAHDFNNLLTAVSGYAQLAERQLDDGHPARRHLREIAAVVQRAVRLTRQLLAFSRRQELAPSPLDLGALLRELEPMLQHAVGPHVSVHLQVDETGTVVADVGQLEQVVMNLVANARDAMAGGGEVVVRCERVAIPRGTDAERLAIAPGPYVALSVTDTGTGMDDATAARVFDPFFTTKERGGGTGLGLSMVHGIVRQSGGAVDVRSEPGAGSTFCVLLPLADVG
jgi:two-component system cell cycle sensor histidine kinase/response regulator CckA